MAGVAIILAPVLVLVWNIVGSMPALTSSTESNFSGGMIGVSLSYPIFCTNYGKTQRIEGQIKFFIASIYHPVDPKEQAFFSSELSIFYEKMPRNAEIISGQDVNVNVGIRLKLYADVLGPHGIYNMSSKGKKLLSILKTKYLRALNSYFIHYNYCNNSKSQYMLANFFISTNFKKRVEDCGVTKYGVRSDHVVVKLTFRLRAFKLKVYKESRQQIDWKVIGSDEETNLKYNTVLKENNTNNHIFELQQ